MIYFAQLDSGAIKIGFSDRVKARMFDLATHHRSKVVLLTTIPGDKGTEREIHDRFAHLRVGKGEQFKPGPDLIEFMGSPANLIILSDDVGEQPKNPSPTFPRCKQRSFRLTAEAEMHIAYLRVVWSPVAHASAADVVIEALRRAYEEEAISTADRDEEKS